jgi:DNA polymerase I-like protein with 3'-5' exonuclease and polymerase domains
MIAAVHDELLLEVDEDQVERAKEILEEQMVAAFTHWFPRAPTLGLVKIQRIRSWADAD